MTTTIGEKIIVSLTSYGERLNNLPVVLNTIFTQTLLPDIVVLNLAYEEVLPEKVEAYLNSYDVEINRVPDTKVYKKLIPTLKKYPNDCIISIDDDWLYPAQMIEDFITVHENYPNNPISGNKVVIDGMVCHCGCASLVKREYLEMCLDLYNEDIFNNCKSDDIFYSYCATKSGHPYVRSIGTYFTNMESYNSILSYSADFPQCVNETWKYLNCKYGSIDPLIERYFQLGNDESIIDIMKDIEASLRKQITNTIILQQKYESVLSSHAFRLGNFILKPIYWIKKIIKWNK